MRQEPELDPLTERILHLADPCRDPDVAAAGLDAGPALRAFLAGARPAGPGRLPGRASPVGRRRLPIALAAGAVAAAVSVAIVLPAGDGPTPAADAAILSGARQALIPRPGVVLEIAAEVTKGSGPPVLSRSWTATAAPHDQRAIGGTVGRPTVETAVDDGRPEVYDPSTGTIYQGAPLTAPGADGPAVVSWIAMLRPRGRTVTIDRDARLGGQRVIEVTRRLGPGTERYWMTRTGYRPLQFTDTTAGVPGATIIRYRTWQALAGAGTGRLTSLRAQHPEARVDSAPGAYRTVSARLERAGR